MKKIFFCIFILFSTLPIFTFDFGGSIYNDLNLINTDNFALKDDLVLNLYFTSPLDYQGNTKINFDGSFHTDFSLPKEKATNYLDVNQLNLSMSIPLGNNVDCNFLLGRDYFADITQLIYKDKIDGLFFGFTFSHLDFNLLAGYTGLLNHLNHKSTFFTSILSSDKKTLYCSASKNGTIIAQGNINIYDLIILPDISLETLFFLNPQNPYANNIYLTLNLKNDLSKNFQYNIISSLQYKLTTKSKPANLTYGELIYTIKYLSISGNALFSSYDNDKLSQFVPYTPTNLTKIETTMLADLLKAGIKAKADMINKASLILDVNLFWDLAKAKPIYKYKGLQWDLILDIYSLSDFSMYINFGQFLYPEFKTNFYLQTSIKFDF